MEVFMHQGVKNLTDCWVTSCAQLLQNKELIRYLEESNFDAILTDTLVPFSCGLDLDARLCPSPPSYVPRVFTDQMSFLQRVKNLLFDIPNVFLCDFVFEPYSKLASEFLQREVTVQDLLRKGSVWLLRMEFVLDYPRPLIPNIIPIGGVSCAHKGLPQAGHTLFLIHSLIDIFVQDI
uniref:Uncharacterized protein n=1 Tax=Serinus canaria TaxID=9135 RepID=A0A8C9N361_SERCA